LLPLVVATLALVVPHETSAQSLLEGPPSRGWRPTLGVRGGLDYRSQDASVGTFLRLPVPGLPAALTPSGDLVFRDGLTERQAILDVTARLGGFYVGGGPLVLHSIFRDETEYETKTGYTFVMGLSADARRFGTNLEFRWARVGGLSPKFVTLAFTWTPGARSGRGGF